jgi:hypothetical protein
VQGRKTYVSITLTSTVADEDGILSDGGTVIAVGEIVLTYADGLL